MKRLQFENSDVENNDQNSSPVLQKLLDKIRSVEEVHQKKQLSHLDKADELGVVSPIKVGLSCYAYLQDYNAESRNFSLTVECIAVDSNPVSKNERNGILVGSNVYPYEIVPGAAINLCLKSSIFEADHMNGEDIQLTKHELFKGRTFEKQFALRNIKVEPKVLKGIFGKVIVETIADNGDVIQIGDFNLRYQTKKLKVSKEEDNKWIVLGFKELAESLGLFQDDETSKSLHEELGFTQYEIETFEASTDPFCAMLKLFKKRKGTASEFVQKLYSCKRKQNLEPIINGFCGDDLSLTTQLSSSSSTPAQVSNITEDLTEAAGLLLTPPPTPRKRGMNCDGIGTPIKKPKLRLDFHSSLETIDDSDADAETIPAEEIEMHVFPPTPRKFDAPLSPPLTPLKRLTSSVREQHRNFFNNNNNIFVFPDKE